MFDRIAGNVSSPPFLPPSDCSWLVQRLLLKAFGLRLRDRRVQIRELLHDDVLMVLQRDRVVLLAIPLQGRFGGFDLASLFAEPVAEPVAGLLGGHELVLEILLDVVLRDRIDHAHRQLRIGEPVI